MSHQQRKNLQRKKRHGRIRKAINGTPERPRLCVSRTLNHIYAQVIDDTKGITIVSASTASPDIRTNLKNGGNKVAAEAVGTKIAQSALSKGIKTVVFDRGSFMFHGRIKALAEAARKAGLSF